MYVSREQLLAAIQLLEKEEQNDLLGGTIRYRELTGQERLDANQAAVDATGDEDHPDHDMYRAMVVSFGLLEPKLTADDVFALQKGRFAVVNDLAARILSLSEAAPGDMKSGGAAPDDGQSDAEGSAEPAGNKRRRSAADAAGSGSDHVGANEYAPSERAA